MYSKYQIISSYIKIIVSYGSNTLSSKSWVIKSRFSFNVRQHGQQQLYLQYKVSWMFYKMIGAPSFLQPYLCIQLPLKSPQNIRSSTLVYFHLPITPLFVHKIIFTTPTSTPFLYTSSISYLDNRAHNHWFLFCQTHKTGILQVMRMIKISDEDDCNRNSKLSNSTYLIPSTYCHYFHTLLIPSQELKFSWEPVASFTKFSILIYNSCPSSPIYLQIIPSYSAIKIGSIALPLHIGIRLQKQINSPKDPYTSIHHGDKDMWIKYLTADHQI